MFFKYSRTAIKTETSQTVKLKNPLNKMISGNNAVPEVIRTPDLPLRRRSLYPAELRKHKKIEIFYRYIRKYFANNKIISDYLI